MIIPVKDEKNGYDIVLQNGALSHIGEYLALDRKVLIVTDDGVPEEYSRAVSSSSKEPVTVVLTHGEPTKSLDSFARLLSVMLDKKFTRFDCVVAVGGGVIGDLAGFVSSAYMRGIDFYNVPTTLLADCDSSIGGKCAIDFGGVKNSVGAFRQPKKVVIDPDTLATLEPRQIRAGLAEAVKMAATSDKELFSFIENSKNISDDLGEIIYRSLLIKKGVVERDPHESGERRVLNFGHTVGHAIESRSNGALLHGECVATGMLPMCADKVRGRLSSLLEKLGLPTTTEYTADEMLPYIVHDKKANGDKITAVIVDEIGSYRFESLSPDDIRMRIGQSGITGGMR